MATTGNTVRLTVTFKDWDNVLVDPTGVKLRIYDADKVQLGADITVGIDHVSTGVYRYEYTVPAGNEDLYAEFSGTSGGTTVLGRTRIEREFTND